MLGKIRSFFTIDMDRLKTSREGLPLFVDIMMVLLVIINLGFIFFDWSYHYHSFRSLVGFISPSFNLYYSVRIHPNASYLDLIFVGIFISELLIRWGQSIYRKTHDKWFFYPIVHWYDVLGCIPMSGIFKSFRLFRIFGMILRLHKLGIINIESTYLYKKSKKYSELAVEEISDRVVTNVLTGAQNEITKDSPVVHNIVTRVLIPQKDKIDEWLNNQLSEIISMTYYQYRNDLNLYLQEIVKKSVHENPEIKRISLIPGIGNQIKIALESSISNITFNVVDNALEDMSKNKQIPALEDVTSHLLNAVALDDDRNAELNILMKSIAFETLEIVKKHVEIKLWKIKEFNERIKKLEQKIAKGAGNSEAAEMEINILTQKIEALKKI